MSEKLKNEFRNEKEKLSRMSFGQKAQYIFDYYKFYIIAFVVAVSLIYYVVTTFLNNKPLAFYCMMLNASGPEVSMSEEELESRFAAFAEVNDGSEKVVIDTTASFNPNVNSQYSMAQNAKITALFASHDLDAMVIDPGVFTYYGLNGAFTDLREVLNDDEFEKYRSGNRIYYIDGAIQEKLKNLDADQTESVMAAESGAEVSEPKTGADAGAIKNGDKSRETGDPEAVNDVAGENRSDITAESSDSSEETLGEMAQFAAELMGEPDVVSREAFTVPDPEKMEDPIPVGIIVTDAPKIADGGFFSRTVPVFGVPVVSERKELSVKFLHFLEER
ncbi:hypothetical protein BXO88_05630 [Oribacterium sp. C9]|uniref:hypothetical protein n=1 Tax=Oribacterium sp. C9 TaxID=1943579 RepID=UPI00098EFE46|nr:hypothetical protein [Oribacterium sp. C9]OON87020.1 hypothetical protein BXO88_05630 [Oribacterium sp. C9]